MCPYPICSAVQERLQNRQIGTLWKIISCSSQSWSVDLVLKAAWLIALLWKGNFRKAPSSLEISKWIFNESSKPCLDGDVNAWDVDIWKVKIQNAIEVRVANYSDETWAGGKKSAIISKSSSNSFLPPQIADLAPHLERKILHLRPSLSLLVS